MAVRDITAPVTSRSRKPKYPFSDKEVQDAIKMLKGGKTPGVGPYEGENALREARSAGQSLVRHVVTVDPSFGSRLRSSARPGA